MALFNFFSGEPKKEIPDFISRYLAIDFKFDKSTLIEDIAFCVLDCETTGLEKDAEIITIGAVTVKNGKIQLKNILDQKYRVSGNSKAEIHGELNVTDNTEDQLDLAVKLLQYI